MYSLCFCVSLDSLNGRSRYSLNMSGAGHPASQTEVQENELVETLKWRLEQQRLGKQVMFFPCKILQDFLLTSHYEPADRILGNCFASAEGAD